MDGGRCLQVEPDDITVDEIHQVRDQFISAAKRAEKAGFDGIQLHAARFFFLSRFISLAVNHRSDEYGGSTGNRALLVPEILRGIREAVPALHTTVKINCSDFTYGGLNETESMAICRLLSDAGIDSIEAAATGPPYPVSVRIRTRRTSVLSQRNWRKRFRHL